MSDAPSNLRPMRPILRQPFVETVLPVDGQPDVPAPATKPALKPKNWTRAQLLQDIKCDGGTGIYAKAKAANGGKDPIFKSGHSSIGSGGSTDEDKGVITLDPNQDRAYAAQVAIFELTNLSNKARFDKLNADTAAGNHGREQYTKAAEAIEYGGIANANKAFHACGAAWGVAKGTRSRFAAYDGAKDFEDFYKNYQKSVHKDFYRHAWDKSYKHLYDAVHHLHKKP